MPKAGLYAHFGKRTLDLVLAVPALILLAPVLLVIALAIRLSSSGRVIFRQQRVGRGGRPFWILKFRTMYSGSDEKGPIASSDDDSRVLPIGKFLRRWKLDELPQLWNVFRGEMSLVGPRPLVAEQFERFSPEHQRRLLLRPGITSLASICYRNEGALLQSIDDRDDFYGRTIVPRKEMLNDRYLEKLSLALDLKILLLTAFLLFFPGKFRDTTFQAGRLEFRPYSRPVQMVIDLVIFALAVRGAYWLRFEENQPGYLQFQMYFLILVFPLARCSINALAGIYNHVWRHFSMEDALSLVSVAALCSGGLLFLRLSLHVPPEQFPYLRVPLGVICGEYLLTVFGLMTARTLRKAAFDLNLRHLPPRATKPKRILIAGAESVSVILVNRLRHRSEYEIVGFVDDDKRKVGTRIVGIQVLGTCADISQLLTKLKIDRVAICVGGDGTVALQKIQNICREAGVASSVIQDLVTTIEGTHSEPVSGVALS